MTETIQDQEKKMIHLTTEMQKKNEELEERLETVSKLIQKNE
jgi:hypothetical protein